ncbi:MAG TPA: M23 family metallopeptidase [Patescibacteria group bacterium]|nr:M23 family metallopeptidase [Patescibacteria group bacterium]
MYRLLPLLLVFMNIPALAENIKLAWPAACNTGKDCWTVNHIDHDPGAGAKDYTCGTLVYDAHNGTDIALRDVKSMQEGVDVIAAAEGKVVRVRNDVPDHHGTADDLAAARASKKECGNLVSLLHADKWVTEYCHMKMGSVAVRLGDTVRRGQKLGQVGQSGLALFPHLHFGLRHNNAIVDPFTGGAQTASCGETAAPLWEQPVAYKPTSFYAAGFATAPPTVEALARDASSSSTITRDAPALVFWVELFGVKAGDKLTLEIRAPDGSSFARSETSLEKDQIKYFKFTGNKNETALPAGSYHGVATIMRGNTAAGSIERSVAVN